MGEGLVRLLCSESFDIDTVTDKVYYKQRQNNKTTNIFKLKVKKVINLYMSAGYSDYAIQFLLKTSSLVHELGNDQQVHQPLRDLTAPCFNGHKAMIIYGYTPVG